MWVSFIKTDDTNYPRVSLFNTQRIHSEITLSVLGYDVPVWSVTLLQGGLEMYSPLGVM